MQPPCNISQPPLRRLPHFFSLVRASTPPHSIPIAPPRPPRERLPSDGFIERAHQHSSNHSPLSCARPIKHLRQIKHLRHQIKHLRHSSDNVRRAAMGGLRSFRQPCSLPSSDVLPRFGPAVAFVSLPLCPLSADARLPTFLSATSRQ